MDIIDKIIYGSSEKKEKAMLLKQIDDLKRQITIKDKEIQKLEYEMEKMKWKMDGLDKEYNKKVEEIKKEYETMLKEEERLIRRRIKFYSTSRNLLIKKIAKARKIIEQIEGDKEIKAKLIKLLRVKGTEIRNNNITIPIHKE